MNNSKRLSVWLLVVVITAALSSILFGIKFFKQSAFPDSRVGFTDIKRKELPSRIGFARVYSNLRFISNK